jgi:F-type H+-transporting ATPase subunit b
MVDINMTLVAQIFNFLILAAILTKFAYKPLMKVLKEREDQIAKSIESAEADELKAQELLKEYHDQLATARIQAQEIVDKAIKRAQEEREAHINETKREIDQLRKAAQAEIVQERERAVAQLKGEVVALSMAAATKIIGSNIDTEANDRLIGEFIDKLDKDKMGGLPC